MTYLQAIMHRKVHLAIALLVIIIIAAIAAWAISAKAQYGFVNFGGRVVAAIHCQTAAGLMACYSSPPGFLNLSFSPQAILPAKFDAYLVTDIFTARNILIIPSPKLGIAVKSCAGGRVMGQINPGGIFYVPPLHLFVYLSPLRFGAACKSVGI